MHDCFFFQLPCVRSLLSGITDAIGVVTAADLCRGDECEDSMMVLTPHVVPFCSGAAGEAICLAMLTSVAVDDSAVVVSVTICWY